MIAAVDTVEEMTKCLTSLLARGSSQPTSSIDEVVDKR
jgi:hypothetical protein